MLAAEGFARLRGKRVGLLTNQTGQSRATATARSICSLRAPGVTLVALFSPEHGIRGQLDDKVASSRDESNRAADSFAVRRDAAADRRDARRHRHARRRPAGHRRALLHLSGDGRRTCWRRPRSARSRVVVLDRPNPIDGFDVEGPMQDASAIGFNGYLPMPIRHGLTIGELARLFNGEKKIGADLTVVPMKNWRRDDWFDETGLPWVNPSPNMRNMLAATVYPGIGAIEGTNISVGRGTDTPFEQIGAPWIDGPALAAALNARAPAGRPLLSGDVHAGSRRQARRPGVSGRVHRSSPIANACGRCVSVSRSRRRCRGCTVAQFKLEDAAMLFGSKAAIARIRAGDDRGGDCLVVDGGRSGVAPTRAKYLCTSGVIGC